MKRWVVYQRERFPMAAHAALIAAFSASAVCFSSLLRGHVAPPSWGALLVAFVTSLSFFLQLRIADEFKDFEEDRRYRPYRPVPRGLVTLKELGILAGIAALVQIALALWLDPSLLLLLAGVWAYLGLMSREFFVPGWLKRRPTVYMAAHMVIVPLVDFYATACDWWVAREPHPPEGLWWFLLVSFLNGVVIEIGRKTRVPQDEEAGVETYSALWGTGGAVRAWAIAIVLTGGAAWRASDWLGLAGPALVLLVVLAAVCIVSAVRVVQSPRAGSGRVIEVMSGVWTLVMYLGLGAVPLLLAVWSSARGQS